MKNCLTTLLEGHCGAHESNRRNPRGHFSGVSKIERTLKGQLISTFYNLQPHFSPLKVIQKIFFHFYHFFSPHAHHFPLMFCRLRHICVHCQCLVHVFKSNNLLFFCFFQGRSDRRKPEHRHR